MGKLQRPRLPDKKQRRGRDRRRVKGGVARKLDSGGITKDELQIADEHQKLLEAAQDAIDKLFNDTSIATSITRGELEMIRDAINIMLESIPSD